jgi:hypothetical protein
MGVATRVTMRVVVTTHLMVTPEPSLRAETSAFARYPDWYAPLEWYISYGVDQAECAVEGIG